MNALEIKNLTYSYDGSKNIIEGLDLTVEKGKYISLLGHNGCGKSTLARIILGLLPFKEGSIKVFDIELNDKNVHDIRKKTAIVFQNPDNQFISQTVEDDIAFGLENKNVDPSKMKEIIVKYATKVGMNDYLNKEPSYLSGGQKQRVAIAGALAMEPELIIFDEATSMLDPKGRKEILSLIKEMRKENPNITVISITHDVEEANLSDYILVMEDGKIVLKGTPKEIFDNEETLQKFNLSRPFIYDIKDKLTKRGYDVKDVTDIEGLAEVLCR